MTILVLARRVPSWVGPGAPHPDALDAVAVDFSARAPGLDDFVVVHAGALAVVVAIVGRGSPPDEVAAAAAHAFEESNRRGLALGLAAPAAGGVLEVRLPLAPERSLERFAVFATFRAIPGLVERATRAIRTEGALAAAESSEDAVIVARTGAPFASIDEWVAAWQDAGARGVTMDGAAFPGERSRTLAIGFEVGHGRLLGPLDLL